MSYASESESPTPFLWKEIGVNDLVVSTNIRANKVMLGRELLLAVEWFSCLYVRLSFGFLGPRPNQELFAGSISGNGMCNYLELFLIFHPAFKSKLLIFLRQYFFRNQV